MKNIILENKRIEAKEIIIILVILYQFLYDHFWTNIHNEMYKTVCMVLNMSVITQKIVR